MKNGISRSRQWLINGALAVIALISLQVNGQVIPEVYAEGFSSPVAITNAGDERLFVVERGGLIRIIDGSGAVEGTPFLDLSGIITSGGERGLLGLAFHPGYEENGFFFVNYTDLEGNTVIARYSVSADNANLADEASGYMILNIDQPYQNHNGGDLHFGPDGYLYIGTGDGGSGGDPQNNAQDLSSLLGKMLRIDINDGTPYAIPPDNPYVMEGEAAAEIWASGLRNPWRFSFDRQTGDLWIADVGQNAVEEVNVVPAGTGAGSNFGWRCYEGDQEYNTSGCGSAGDYQFPVYQYLHSEDDGCSVTGGYVYRGTEFPSLEGYYFFSDYCNDVLYSLHDSSGEWVVEKHGQFSGNNFSAFGEDMNGELYLAGISSGKVFKLVNDEQQTGIDLEEASPWIIYPNPAGDHVTITSPDGRTPDKIRMMNTAGEIVLDLNGNDASGILDISRSPYGIYILEISSDGRTFYQKLLRIRS